MVFTRTILCARKSFVQVSVLALLVALGTLLTPLPAHAAPTFTVNTTADVAPTGDLTNGICETDPGNGLCTLRTAIIKANWYPGGGVTINLPALPPGGTYLLTIAPIGPDDENFGDLNINASMNIVGGGAASTIIQAGTLGVGGPPNGIDRVFTIAASTNVRISGVTIRNGLVGMANGGGIYNAGNLTLISSAISGNTNLSGSGGGGIFNSGTMTLTNSTVSGNNATYNCTYGGGIHNIGTMTLTNSTVSGNNGCGGGGINNGFGFGSDVVTASMTLTNSTVNGNNAASGGGGIANAATLTITNSTVSGNNSNSNGGGLYSGDGIVNLFNATITNNQADADFNGSGTGGGVYNYPWSTLNFKNSIIALNSETVHLFSNWVPTYGDCTGTLTSQGNSILYNYNTSNCTLIGSVTFVDPNLGPLQSNGGPTQTHALLSGSPAIDAVNVGSCTNPGGPLTTDQRGATRPFPSGCDIGAYEYGGTLPTFAVTGAANPSVGGSVSCTSPVTSGNTTTCTIATNPGYTLTWASSNTCGGSLTVNTFTTGAVTSNCTVTANFGRFNLTPILDLLLLD